MRFRAPPNSGMARQEKQSTSKTLDTSTSSSLVEIDNVDFAYGNRAILKGISLSVPKG